MIETMRRLFKTLCSLLALTIELNAPAFAADLPAFVDQALRQAGVPRSSVAVVVQEVGAPRPALSLNAGASMNPASVMKLVTTYAALELLGPAYRWKTESYADGGALALKGYGDPKLSLESFWMLLRNLRGRGWREIQGDIVLDRSWFAPQPEARFDDDTYRPYNVAPDALLVNFKTLRFNFIPQAESGTVRVFVEPALPGLELVNTLRLVEASSCPEGRAFRERIQAEFRPRPPRAAFTGPYPAACGERDMNVALHQPEDYVAGMIRQLWREMGGTWNGEVREGVVSPAARLVYSHESEPLAATVRDINKFSNNVMARQLYLTLAAEMGGAPARPEQAFASIKEFLEKKGIKAPELVMENGSGLSRIERISAASLAALLQTAWRSAVMPEFVASLPVAAADGTMKRRLRGERVAGQAHVKTGLLNDARTMAGYVLDRSGKRHVVVMLINHPNAPQADAAQDALLAWVYEGARGLGRATSRPRGASPRHP
jgi:D-alanyl-D-alanine carboxypeptidase/D-alanyl-D-alanine-endopeptidase (penicillin-binding protein 4)